MLCYPSVDPIANDVLYSKDENMNSRQWNS